MKRVMLFYTPRSVWGPNDAPDNAGFEGPTVGTLEQSFRDAVTRCESIVSRLSVGSLLDVKAYANCIVDFFDHTVYPLHTALRGVAIVPEVVSEVPGYSMPGRCIPAGYITEFEVPIPPEGLSQFLGEYKVWIFANGPVVVPPTNLEWPDD